MAISSFPPVSTGGGVSSVTFKYTTPSSLKIFPWTRDTWTAAKVYFTPDSQESDFGGAIVGFMNAAKQPIGTVALLNNVFTVTNILNSGSSQQGNLGVPLVADTSFGSLVLSGAPSFVTLFSQKPGTFVIEESIANNAAEVTGTLTTVTASNASYVLANPSWVTVIGGGGGGNASPGFNFGRTAAGSGYATTAFVPAGTYNVTIGAGGARGTNANSFTGQPGGDSSFVGGAINLVARGGNKAPNGTTEYGRGGSGGSQRMQLDNNKGGVAGGPGSGVVNNGSGVVPPPWVPISTQPADRFGAGGVYGGGGASCHPFNGEGVSALANTGGGGGAGSSASNETQNGGEGGSGVVYIFTPPA
jgi:hypothetical protein